MMKRIIVFISLLLTFSCSEETFTKKTQKETFVATDVETFSMNTCANMHFERPPVDILFLVDNSGSTTIEGFNQLRSRIASTINTLSDEFDYHMYITPILPLRNDSINGYQLLVNNPNHFDQLANLNITSVENVQFFAPATGNNQENGFDRAYDLINSNRSNGIFRENAHTVVLLISNGDDTSAFQSIGGNQVFDPAIFGEKKNRFISLASSLSAQSFRFFTLVAHTQCQGFREGLNYKRMSRELYDHYSFGDDSAKNTYDLCSGNYGDVFSSINNSIKAEVVGHEYDHWKISDQPEERIQLDQIVIKKVSPQGQESIIEEDAENGYEYLGYRSDFPIRSKPTRGEPQTGIMVKLNGSAQLKFPECLIAKTQTPTEYFGYIVLKRDPDLETVRVKIRGQDIPMSPTNGWSYVGYLETRNIKVPGPTDAPVTPAVNRSGYFLQLNGDALYSNGDSVEVSFQPKAL